MTLLERADRLTADIQNGRTIPLSQDRFLHAPERFKLVAGHVFFHLLISGGKLPLPEQKRLFLQNLTEGRSIVSWLKPMQGTLGFESIRQVNMSETELIGSGISQNAAWQYSAALHRFTGLESCLWFSKIHSEPDLSSFESTRYPKKGLCSS